MKETRGRLIRIGQRIMARSEARPYGTGIWILESEYDVTTDFEERVAEDMPQILNGLGLLPPPNCPEETSGASNANLNGKDRALDEPAAAEPDFSQRTGVLDNAITLSEPEPEPEPELEKKKR